MSQRKFQLSVVLDAFRKTLQDDGTLLMDEYIRGYDELCVFFDMLGSVFGFITADVKEKIGILQEHRKSENGEKYLIIQGMFDFEIDKNLTQKRTAPLSGSRTLLRLHRALAFTMLFMKKLSEASEHDSSSSIAADAYKQSLANYHPWLVRKAAVWAMYTLPNIDDLKKKIAAPNMEHQEMKQLLKDVTEVMKPVYDITEELYTRHNLHGLP